MAAAASRPCAPACRASYCYELIYRNGLVLSATGQRLLMGSTTGSLWASDDGGECWTSVAAHLPPIYAVRFG